MPAVPVTTTCDSETSDSARRKFAATVPPGVRLTVSMIDLKPSLNARTRTRPDGTPVMRNSPEAGVWMSNVVPTTTIRTLGIGAPDSSVTLPVTTPDCAYDARAEIASKSNATGNFQRREHDFSLMGLSSWVSGIEAPILLTPSLQRTPYFY